MWLAPAGESTTVYPQGGTVPATQAARLLQQFGPKSVSAGLAPFADTRAPGNAVRGTPIPNVIGLKGPMRVDGTFDGSNAGKRQFSAPVIEAGCALVMRTRADRLQRHVTEQFQGLLAWPLTVSFAAQH